MKISKHEDAAGEFKINTKVIDAKNVKKGEKEAKEMINLENAVDDKNGVKSYMDDKLLKM